MKVTIRIHAVSLSCAAALGVSALPASAQTADLAAATTATFVDPTARLVGRPNITLGRLVYVAPFATLKAGGLLQPVRIGNESNVQDSVVVDATTGGILIGDQVILAHGATVKGPAALGMTGKCPVKGQTVCPSFVSFNAVVDGAIVQKDAMVSALARVAPGVTIPSGRRVLSGANVTSNAQVTAKSVAVTEADRLFMDGVIEVNREFAVAYTELAAAEPDAVRGIGLNPATAFNPLEKAPTLNGVSTVAPAFRNRIIGDVRIGNTAAQLNQVMGAQISLRADEGNPFVIGSIASMASNTTFHALENTDITVGSGGRYGYHSVVHGGGGAGQTSAGDDLSVGDWAVLFRSSVGSGTKIGYKSLVQQANLPAGTVVPDCTVMIGTAVTPVEWCDITP
jgi:carbonic anhydrase/acetyltransferase-like protein (isoleucine patch superfamily)